MQSKHFLRDHVRQAIKEYFASLEGDAPRGIYEMVVHEVENPLLEMVMQETRGNQSLAATWLGLNRGTLRKLLAKHGLLKI